MQKAARSASPGHKGTGGAGDQQQQCVGASSPISQKLELAAAARAAELERISAKGSVVAVRVARVVATRSARERALGTRIDAALDAAEANREKRTEEERGRLARQSAKVAAARERRCELMKSSRR